MATCKSCDAPIVWAQTEPKNDKPGRAMPLDANDDGSLAVPGNGNIIVTAQGPRGPVVRYVPAGRGLHVSHFATCPNAKQHRKAKS